MKLIIRIINLQIINLKKQTILYKQKQLKIIKLLKIKKIS